MEQSNGKEKGMIGKKGSELCPGSTSESLCTYGHKTHPCGCSDLPEFHSLRFTVMVKSVALRPSAPKHGKEGGSALKRVSLATGSMLIIL